MAGCCCRRRSITCERVADGHPIDPLPMMQIFRVKHGATSQRRSSENETVIHRKPIPLDEVEREFMRLDVDGLYIANSAHRRPPLADFRYPPLQLTGRDRGEFAENLTAHHSAGGQQRL